VQAKQVPDRSMSRKTALIFGISGQDGAYLAKPRFRCIPLLFGFSKYLVDLNDG
jgi:hypothetical protein